VATYIGINWADQKHDVILRSASEPAKVEHSQIAHEPDALMGGSASCTDASLEKAKFWFLWSRGRGALIYHLMGYEFLELYPIIGSISAHCAAVRSLG
jgi:hypothetical protein